MSIEFCPVECPIYRSVSDIYIRPVALQNIASSVLFHEEIENFAIDLVTLAIPALFQVLGAHQRTQRFACRLIKLARLRAAVMSGTRQQGLYLASIISQRYQVIGVNFLEEEVVQIEQPLQFCNGLGVVIHPQIEITVVVSAIAAPFADHEYGRRLPATAVTT